MDDDLKAFIIAFIFFGAAILFAGLYYAEERGAMPFPEIKEAIR